MKKLLVFSLLFLLISCATDKGYYVLDNERYDMVKKWDNPPHVKSWTIRNSVQNSLFSVNNLEVFVWNITLGNMLIAVEHGIHKNKDCDKYKTKEQRFLITLYDKYGIALQNVVAFAEVSQEFNKGTRVFLASGQYNFKQIDHVGVERLKSVWK